ncbi:MAG: branched-chain amino acid ABC transporter permease [Hyphomicrobiales bacterium]|nr:branched-chain amino acid ABC transporter permease [Hyphomicrobiales bacterium]
MNQPHRVLPLALGLLLVAGLAGSLLQPYEVYLISLWAVYTISALGLNLTLGFAGQISLAQASFVGFGAYATALLLPHGVPFGVTLVIGAAISFILGILLGFPALRVQGHYLAFVTLALATIAFLVFRNESWLTHGTSGIDKIARPFPFTSGVAYMWLCLGSLALVTLGVWWLLRSPWGRAFLALRENPVRAASLGIDVRTYTLLAFAIGAALGGVSGALFAPLGQYIEPSEFALPLSFSLLLMVVVGGSGTFMGPFLGAIVSVALPEVLRSLQDYYLLIYGIIVILLLVFSPDGVVGIIARAVARLRPAAAPVEPTP